MIYLRKIGLRLIHLPPGLVLLITKLVRILITFVFEFDVI